MTNLVLLTSLDSSTCFRLVEELLKQMPDARLLVVFERRVPSFRTRCRTQLNHLRRSGILWIPYRVVMGIKTLVKLLKRAPDDEKTLLDGAGLLQSSYPDRLTLQIVKDLHAKGTLALIQEFSPQAGIVFGTRILKRKLFSIPTLGMVNIHQGLIPYYRGMPPAFWEMYNGERETGVSFHQVTDGLDSGALLHQERIPIGPSESLADVRTHLDEVAVRLLPSVLAGYISGKADLVNPDLSQGKCYTTPTVSQIIRFECRRRLRA